MRASCANYVRQLCAPDICGSHVEQWRLAIALSAAACLKKQGVKASSACPAA